MKKRRNSKIEFAPEKYRITCFYDEAVLYCFQLEIDGKRGWRLPSSFEYSTMIEFRYSICWWLDGNYSNIQKIASPVRDL
jgi:hypothetical protein